VYNTYWLHDAEDLNVSVEICQLMRCDPSSCTFKHHDYLQGLLLSIGGYAASANDLEDVEAGRNAPMSDRIAMHDLHSKRYVQCTSSCCLFLLLMIHVMAYHFHFATGWTSYCCNTHMGAHGFVVNSHVCARQQGSTSSRSPTAAGEMLTNSLLHMNVYHKLLSDSLTT
jgi:hypothetical protein